MFEERPWISWIWSGTDTDGDVAIGTDEILDEDHERRDSSHLWENSTRSLCLERHLARADEIGEFTIKKSSYLFQPDRSAWCYLRCICLEWLQSVIDCTWLPLSSGDWIASLARRPLGRALRPSAIACWHNGSNRNEARRTSGSKAKTSWLTTTPFACRSKVHWTEDLSGDEQVIRILPPSFNWLIDDWNSMRRSEIVAAGNRRAKRSARFRSKAMEDSVSVGEDRHWYRARSVGEIFSIARKPSEIISVVFAPCFIHRGETSGSTRSFDQVHRSRQTESTTYLKRHIPRADVHRDDSPLERSRFDRTAVAWCCLAADLAGNPPSGICVDCLPLLYMCTFQDLIDQIDRCAEDRPSSRSCCLARNSTERTRWIGAIKDLCASVSEREFDVLSLPYRPQSTAVEQWNLDGCQMPEWGTWYVLGIFLLEQSENEINWRQ